MLQGQPNVEIQFSDDPGATWSAADVLARAVQLTGAANTLYGTAQGDVFDVDNEYDVVIEAAGGGVDTVRSTGNYTLPANVENLELRGFAYGGTGNALDNVLRGNDLSNGLTGGGGRDTYEGGRGDDLYYDMANRAVVTAQATVTEREGEGYDTLITNMMSVDMAANLEELRVSGKITAAAGGAAHQYSGNELDNRIDLREATFAAGTQVRVDGGEGDDTVIMGAVPVGGSYTVVVDSAGDRIISYGAAVTVESSVSFSLDGGAGKLRLTGADDIYGIGDAGDNTLDGASSAGANWLQGGAGNDTYYADTRDVVVEAAGGGTDTVVLSRSAWASPLQKLGAGAPIQLAGYAHVESLLLAAGFGDANLQGTAGNDTLGGSAGGNRIEGLAGNDTLYSGGGQDELLGGAGNDTLYAQGGQVMADGGAGNDTILGAGARLQVVLAAGGGADTVQSNLTRTAAQWATQRDTVRDVLSSIALADGSDASALRFVRTGKDLTVQLAQQGTPSVTVKGYFADAQGADVVSDLDAVRLADGTYLTRDAMAAGLGRASLQAATAGNDLLVTSAALRTLAGGAGNDHVYGQADADTLDGGAGSDRLYGGDGADKLTGGAGNDTLVGGRGADTYAFAAGWGQDVIDDLQRSERALYADDPLQDDDTVNTVQFDATVAVADVTLRRAGNDLMIAHAPSGGGIRVAAYFDPEDDNGAFQIRFANGTVWNQATIDQQANTVTGTAGADALLALAGGSDVKGLGGKDKLTGQGGADRLYGGAGADTLAGAGGNDLLNGGAGPDAMAGGLGDDTYVVDNAGDTVTEAAGAGRDTVKAGISWTLGANVEALVLTGKAAIDGAGNALANTLTGNAGDNVLDGRGGADAMAGGAGDDVYYADDAGDTVTEAAGAGSDTVITSVAWVLGANVENLILNGTAPIYGYGNALANVITGNAGNNVLWGGAGADTLAGGLGNDVYYVDDAGDTVTEDAGAGSDAVVALRGWKLGANIETLVLDGTGNFNATGNALANTLVGNAGNNVLDGKGGADVLMGGLGNDTYVLSRTSGADTIIDTDATAGNLDVLRLAEGIAVDQVWLRRVGNDLDVSIIGTGAHAAVRDWYLGAQNRVEEFRAADGQVLRQNKVQALVNAMDGFGVTLTGQPNLPAGHPQLKAAIDMAWA